MTLELMFELAWKSGLIAGAALVAASLLGARPAGERVAVLRLGLVILLALPLLMALMPALRIQTPAFAEPAAAAAPAAPPVATPAPDTPVPRLEAASTGRPVAGPEWRIDPVAVLLAIWAAGCAFLLIRLTAGVALLHRWTRDARPVSDSRWLAALARAAQGRRPPVLRASSRVTSPLSWGWRPAVILLDPAALDQAGRADAVLAHEMGHVRHGDWLFLMASRLVVALFWFNPLVWVLERELARRSEQAADRWAADRIGRAEYASALVALAARARPHAALGMAPPRSELARRVIAVMHASAHRGSPWRAALAISACVGFATPLAAVDLGPAALETALPVGPLPAPVQPGAPSARVAAAAIAAAMTPTASPAGPPLPAEIAVALRQRDEGLAMMEAGARTMEEQAREMRIIAARLDPRDRASLNADADALLRDAAQLRAEARELAALDPATLRPMSPEDQRRLTDGLRQLVSTDLQARITAEAPVTTTGDALSVTVPASLPLPLSVPVAVNLAEAVETDSSGAWRTADGLEVDASGALRTASGLAINASGEIRAPNGARIDAAGEIRAPAGADQRRVGARQLREAALEAETSALTAEREAAAAGDAAREAEGRARASDMRRRAADLRRQANAMAPDG